MSVRGGEPRCSHRTSSDCTPLASAEAAAEEGTPIGVVMSQSSPMICPTKDDVRPSSAPLPYLTHPPHRVISRLLALGLDCTSSLGALLRLLFAVGQAVEDGVDDPLAEVERFVLPAAGAGGVVRVHAGGVVQLLDRGAVNHRACGVRGDGRAVVDGKG